MEFDPRVMVLTDGLGDDLVERVLAAIRGGATCVQLRAKGASARAIHSAAVALVAATRVPILVNDRLDIALAAGAAGVHLGPADLPVEAARALSPPGFLVGGSAGSAEAARALEAAGASYVGVGAIFDAHGSKPDASAPRGPDVLRAVRRAVQIPIVAIGGIECHNAALCIDAGAHGVAVIRAVFEDREPARIQARARALRDSAFGGTR